VSLELLVAISARYIHIACAIILLGGPFFIRFALLPAAKKSLEPDGQEKLESAINGRWRIVVYCVITLFILTGLYQFLVPVRENGVLITARWRDFSEADKKIYHMIFGIKMLGAFAIFFLASALAGRTQTFAPIRKKSGLFLGIFLVIAALVLAAALLLTRLPL